VWRREREPPSDDLVEIRADVRGIGQLVMSMDARLAEIVDLLRDEDEDDAGD
jgi:hypothetical protein